MHIIAGGYANPHNLKSQSNKHTGTNCPFTPSLPRPRATAKAIALAQAQINAGADVLLVQVDAAGLPVLTLAEQAGVYAIGTAQDQHTVAPKVVLTSIMQNVPALFLHGATLVQQGRWEGKQYKLGLQDGVQDLAPFYGLLTPDQEQTVKAIRNDIMLGKINLLP